MKDITEWFAFVIGISLAALGLCKFGEILRYLNDHLYWGWK